ncbi:Rpn family recombination-promoting nuclease/putative transposase [Brevibacillus dissolubilis]|uniref:Rpn family recombination-promoting nuclease/putative transposase n=1 Tax=Brevibacillus dissolubilis TaxID=1844116 RepID=UPI0011164441|nr:Rpn family recombination-promoting nuclease/putative transposase [Brevibacillus dissolubilis]
MPALVDLRIDFAFKLLFGREGHEPILIAFLNAILKLSEDQRIEEILYVNPEIQKEHPHDKKVILDINVQTRDRTQINIEIQLSRERAMTERFLYYWTRLFTLGIREGNDYAELRKTITINIMNFRYTPDTIPYHTKIELWDIQHHRKFSDLLQIHLVELPKLLDQWKRGLVNPWEDQLVRWLLLLEASEDEHIMKVLEEIAVDRDAILKQAFEVMDQISSDPNLRYAYLSELKARMDEGARKAREAKLEKKLAETSRQMEEAERELKEKEQERRAIEQEMREIEQEKRAIEQEMKAIEQEMKENQQLIVQNLIQKGMDDPFISEVTGLPVSVISALRKH